MKSNEFVGKVARMLVGLAKKETPATYVYILGAIFELLFILLSLSSLSSS
ncbi:hypothetical protein [Paenibacillus mucilaginosus]|uniref:Uncharacterized protein n=1 Tax=Paenibacillus mucilaginosus (strain KNP414) TaxID=1036673 RepID=F8FRH4_PAEMK|nr:hypothetical protein [Paenibacillus mucilaginosus]AEI40531.1 hypothetical protein KNP414_01970 [Paenibacillus mucilaginosus KNP414]MCG7216327.1 hypothetical protein [Paenibacillus mucilaginosus]WDM31493.1 hypothetical protein KCX80_11350 [Paenibacillus mucilaginosus]